MALAIDGTPGVTSSTTLTGGATTFTIPLPQTSNGSGVIIVVAQGAVFSPSSSTLPTDNSGVTGAWSVVTSTAGGSPNKYYRAAYSGNIGAGKTVTITMGGANDNVAGVAFAVSGCNTSSPSFSGFPITGTTSDLLFTATGSVFCFAFYNTSAGSTNQGAGWTQIVGGLSGVSNSPIFGSVLEYQIATSPSALDATLVGGTPVTGLGDAIVIAGAAPPAASGGTMAMMGVG